MKSYTFIPFEDLVMPSEPGKTMGDLLNEALTTGVYPVADSSVISGFDEDFNINDPDSWVVDPLNRFGVGIGDLLQTGALHRSSLTDVQAPSSASSVNSSVDPPVDPPVDPVAQPAPVVQAAPASQPVPAARES